MNSPLNCPIILASTSPRRVDLLTQVGLQFIPRAPETDETPRKGEKPDKLVHRLAREKAESVMNLVLWEYGAAMIIAADTIVVAPGGSKILGKPRDEADARRMLGLIQGKTHVVHTGYCILACAREMKPKIRVRVVTTRVKMRKLTRDDIARYVATREPMDKAGAYAAQGIGMAMIERISGSYTNVVGLPISNILEDLENVFDVGLLSWVSP
jgi:septum formation protein